MFFETYYFEKNYEASVTLGRSFLATWGSDPKAYKTPASRTYINTAKTYQMISAFVVGDTSQAYALARDFRTNPPASDEIYATCYTPLTADVIGFLSSEVLAESPDIREDFRSHGENTDLWGFRAMERQFRMKRRSVEFQLGTKY